MQPIDRILTGMDWATVIITLSVLLLVIAKSLFYQRFMNFVILPFNNKYLFMYNKKDKLLNGFHTAITLFQILNFALFIFLGRNAFFPEVATRLPFVYFMILGGILLYVVGKILLQLANAFVFNSSEEITQLIFKKLSYFNYSGFVMLLTNIVLCYIAPASKIIVFISSILIITINVIGWGTVLRNHQKFVTTYFFYFILYLCALEIAPIAIIASYLKE